MTLVSFTVPGAAAPQGSKKHVGRGVMVESSKRVRPWRTDVREAAMAALLRPEHGSRVLSLPEPTAEPVRVEVTFSYRRPSSHFRADGVSLSATGRRHPIPGSRGDIDKLLRALFDAMTSVVFLDDRQVAEVAASKVWGERDEARVLVCLAGWRRNEEIVEAAA